MQQATVCVTWNKNFFQHNRGVPEDGVNVCWLLWQLRWRKERVWLHSDVPSVLPLAAPVLDDDLYVDRLTLSLYLSPTTLLLMSAFVFSPKDAVSAATDEERLIKIHDVIQQLPPPHYRLGQRHTSPLWQMQELPDYR